MTVLAALPVVQFVIGLREGLEAALVVGIIASFLAQQGRRDALRQVWAGVGLAVALCVAAAVLLEVIDENLPQRQQEAFEAVIGVVAVAVVTSMIFYMRRHARSMGGELRGQAAGALARGSATALVAMAFFAVLREGLETAVFLLATFQSSLGVDPVAAGAAAVLGLALAALLGWGIYRGGVRIDLGRFFKVTGVLLVVIAAGLLSSAVHHAGEAGWLQSSQLLDLSAVIEPASDSVTSGLITGLLGIYPFPTTAEVIAWLAYAVPMLLVVLWPAGRPVPRRAGAAAASPEAPAVTAP